MLNSLQMEDSWLWVIIWDSSVFINGTRVRLNSSTERLSTAVTLSTLISQGIVTLFTLLVEVMSSCSGKLKLESKKDQEHRKLRIKNGQLGMLHLDGLFRESLKPTWMEQMLTQLIAQMINIAGR
jgi:hypothetical protein